LPGTFRRQSGAPAVLGPEDAAAAFRRPRDECSKDAPAAMTIVLHARITFLSPLEAENVLHFIKRIVFISARVNRKFLRFLKFQKNVQVPG
jgi:hypothetical protein